MKGPRTDELTTTTCSAAASAGASACCAAASTPHTPVVQPEVSTYWALGGSLGSEGGACGAAGHTGRRTGPGQAAVCAACKLPAARRRQCAGRRAGNAHQHAGP